MALFGLAFKSGTDDLWESPRVVLAERLIGRGYPIETSIGTCSSRVCMGRNRDSIEWETPQPREVMAPSPAAAMQGKEIIVVGHAKAMR